MKIKLIDKNTAKEMIVKNHYSHKWTSCRYPFGLFEQEDLIGVAVYGVPIGRRVVKSICAELTNNNVLELTRLWVDDIAKRNTESWFIGQTFKWLRQYTDVKVLISYSDPMFGHIGYIYQATNWLYQGNNTNLIQGFLHKIHGKILHPRTVVDKYGTTKQERLLNIDKNYERIPMKKKHRYIYILRKGDRKRLILKLKHPILPYPKDNENIDW